MSAACPTCGSIRLTEVLHEQSVPANSSIFYASAEEALAAPRGSLTLVCCSSCGLLFNADFDSALCDYTDYIETQSTSAEHVNFQRALARSWVDRYGLESADVVEVGCDSDASFLRIFCELSGGHGIGIGPSANVEKGSDSIRLVQEALADAHVDLPGTALICRHTLEHIGETRPFLDIVRRWSERHDGAVVLFEVPDAERIMRETAFWDVYFEHVGYYTAATLRTLFELAGFAVERCEKVFHDQFLVLEARAAASAPAPNVHTGVAEAERLASNFSSNARRAMKAFSTAIAGLADDGPIVIWQAGSKTVGMLATTAVDHLVTAVTDANAEKYGLHLAGTGHPIVAPDRLVELRPAHVVLMNEAYMDEVGARLRALGVNSMLHSAKALLADSSASAEQGRVQER